MRITGHIFRTGGADDDVADLFGFILKALSGDEASRNTKVGNVPLGALIADFGLDAQAESVLDSVTKFLGGVKPGNPMLAPVGGVVAAVEIDARSWMEKQGLDDLPFVPPNPRLTTTTGSNGGFTIDTPAQYNGVKAHLEIHRAVTQTLMPGVTLTHRFPLYRSGRFTLTDRTVRVPVCVHVRPSRPGETITQAEVDGQIAAAKKSGGLDSLTGWIRGEYIAVRGKKSGAEVTFHLDLAPRTGANLDRFIDIDVSAFDLDLPGPDFITGLCVDTDQIKREVNKQANKIEASANDRIKKSFAEALSKSIPAGGSLLRSIVDTMGTLSIHDVRAPVTKVTEVMGQKFETRELALDAAIGFPRKIAP